MKTTILTDEERARRQTRYVHLCALLCVQDRPDTGDGYTFADFEAARAARYEAEDRRMRERGMG